MELASEQASVGLHCKSQQLKSIEIKKNVHLVVGYISSLEGNTNRFALKMFIRTGKGSGS